jgi:hypothetical protein
MQVLTGGLALGALAFACLSVLHGLANTLDACALAIHRAACTLRALQDRRTRALSQDWVRTLERGLAPPDAQEPLRRGRWGSTGD